MHEITLNSLNKKGEAFTFTGLTYDNGHNASSTNASPNNNIPNSNQNSNYSIDLNDNVIIDNKNPDYYKYDNLISFFDIKIAVYKSINLKDSFIQDLMEENQKIALANDAWTDDDNSKKKLIINIGELYRMQ